MLKCLTALAGAALILSGCSGTSIQTYSKPSDGERVYGKVKKVAVLPFDNSVEGDTLKNVSETFSQSLLTNGTFATVEESRYVAGIMKKLKLRNTTTLDRELIKKIGQELGSQAVALGEVLVFGEDDTSETVELATRITLIDVDSGNILWSGRVFAFSGTTLGQVLGVTEGPSVNALAHETVIELAEELHEDFTESRNLELASLLESGGDNELEELPEEGEEVPKEEDGEEEILLKVKPK